MDRKSVESALREYGVPEGELEPMSGILVHHLELVLEENSRQNLTAVEDPAEAIDRHILDSLTSLPVLEDAPPGPVLDLGSGQGYPGIPLAVVSGRETWLLDATRKKVDFLERVIAELGLRGVRAHWSRAEELVGAPEFAFVVSRAVSHTASLLELASPLLADRGILCAMKGAGGLNELEQSRDAAEILGMQPIPSPSGPGTGTVGSGRGTLLVFEKVAESRVPLPRRPGRAQKHPLI